MKKYWAVVLLMSAVVPSYAQSFYKCKTQDGVIYQQIPCKGQSGTVRDTMQEKEAQSKYKAAEKKRQQEEAEKNRIAAESRKKELDSICGTGERGGNVKVGMTEEYFRNCTFQGGQIITVNNMTTAHGVHRQYVIKAAWGGRAYVYTDNGKVTSLQD